MLRQTTLLLATLGTLALLATSAPSGASVPPVFREGDQSPPGASEGTDGHGSGCINVAATPVDLAFSMEAGPWLSAASWHHHPSGGNPAAVACVPLAGFPVAGRDYAILSSGNAFFADHPNTSGSTSAINNPLLAITHGATDFDTVALQLDLKVLELGNCLSFEFRLLSEEYPEWVATQYNDGFVAELNGDTWFTLASVIYATNNFATPVPGQAVSINTMPMTAGAAAGTTYDGATARYVATTPITPGLHTLILTVFDQSDPVYDTSIFLDDLRVYAGECVAGVKWSAP